jgi:hypothetical protein
LVSTERGKKMIMATVVIETQPGQAFRVAQRMLGIQGLGPLRVADHHRLSGLWWLPEGDTAEGLSEALQAMDPDIVAVIPTFTGAA